MKNDTNNTSIDNTNSTEIWWNIANISSPILFTIALGFIVENYKTYKEKQSLLHTVKENILSFLAREKPFNENTIESIKLMVIDPICEKKYLREALIIDHSFYKTVCNSALYILSKVRIIDNSNYNIVFDIFNLTSLVMHWSRGILYYRKEKYMSVAENILSSLHSNIFKYSIKNSQCNQVFCELSELYGRILDANHKSNDALKLFIQAKQAAVEFNSFTEVTAERLIFWVQCKEIANKIKELEVAYNSSSNTFTIAVKNNITNYLIEKCETLVKSYIKLRNDDNVYTSSYLTEKTKHYGIRPSNDPIHFLKCNQKVLYLKCYVLILKLLLPDTEYKTLVSEDIKEIISLLTPSLSKSLENKRHNSLLQSNTIDNSEKLNNDNNHLKNEYNILLHSEIQDAVYLLNSIIKIYDKSLVHTNDVVKIQESLKAKYDQYSEYFTFIFIDNAKFHCMHAKAHNKSNKMIKKLNEQYPNCLDLYVSNIFNSWCSNIKDDSSSIVDDPSNNDYNIQLAGNLDGSLIAKGFDNI